MAKTVNDARIDTRTARERLKTQTGPHWRTLIPGKLHLGYRRRKKEAAGTWIVRRYLGRDENNVGRYFTSSIGTADDLSEADGRLVLSYEDAQKIAHQERLSHTGGLTVEGAIAIYVAALRSEGKASAAGFARKAETHILPTLGRVRVEELRTTTLNVWRDALVSVPPLVRGKAGRPPQHRKGDSDPRARRATANKAITVLRAALNHAFREGHVENDREWRRFQSFKKVNRARAEFLTLDEATRLINAADPSSGFRDLVRAALLTGCRYGELCRLKVRDFANGKIAIRTSKTGHSRHVSLNDDGKAFFADRCIDRSPDDLLLPNRKFGREWRKSEQARPMRGACIAARIPPIGFHQLRHTYASLTIMSKKVPLIVVAHNLGHTDTRMVEAHYGHIPETFKDEAIAEGAPRFGAFDERTNNVRSLSKERRHGVGEG